jgi:hypothetical protein
VAAAAIALAMARGLGAPCALAASLGAGATSSLTWVPSAHRAAAALRERALPASACGRLVWLADRRGPLPADDVAAGAAALSAELGRAATAVGLPGAVALPLARTAALDRVLAWHDAIVVVHDPDAADGVLERALASVAALGRPVAEMVPPRRVAGTLAVSGLAAPSEAAAAVAQLGTRTGRGDG